MDWAGPSVLPQKRQAKITAHYVRDTPWTGPAPWVLPQKRQQQLPKESANVLSYAPWRAHPGSRASAAETRAETDEGDSLSLLGRPKRRKGRSMFILGNSERKTGHPLGVDDGDDPQHRQ